MLNLLIVFVILTTCLAFQGMRNSRVCSGLHMTQSTNKSYKTAAIALLSALSISSTPVMAASYGSFGKGATAVIDPTTAVVVGVTDDVKSGSSSITKYIDTVKSIRSDLSKNAAMDLIGPIKSLPPAGLRDAMNKFNTAFDEETQRGTDRLIRVALQDITELQREVIVKDGKSRSEAKAAIVDKRLAALEDALTTLSSFLK